MRVTKLKVKFDYELATVVHLIFAMANNSTVLRTLLRIQIVGIHQFRCISIRRSFIMDCHEIKHKTMLPTDI